MSRRANRVIKIADDYRGRFVRPLPSTEQGVIAEAARARAPDQGVQGVLRAREA